MYTAPNNVERKIESFLDNFRLQCGGESLLTRRDSLMGGDSLQHGDGDSPVYSSINNNDETLRITAGSTVRYRTKSTSSLKLEESYNSAQLSRWNAAKQHETDDDIYLRGDPTASPIIRSRWSKHTSEASDEEEPARRWHSTILGPDTNRWSARFEAVDDPRTYPSSSDAEPAESDTTPLDTYPHCAYLRGRNSTTFADNDALCWRFSWSTLSGVSSPSSPRFLGGASEASSALGTFETSSWAQDNTCWDYVMGESSCSLTVLDVADPLQTGYAWITGGKDAAGHPIITFPDKHDGDELRDDEYKNVITYLTSIPPLHDVDVGFVVVVDRRHGKWPSVKTLLQRLAAYFPGLLQEVLVLRPTGFLQRTFADMGFKFVKDDFKFQVVMFSSVEDLHKRLQPDQLTEDLGGSLPYNHQEWIQHRAAIEKFSASTSQIGARLRDVCQQLQLTEFPNNVTATEALIADHEARRSEVSEDLSMTIRHGETLLSCIRTTRGADGQETEQPSSELPCNKLAHITAVERLLVQLEETQTNFVSFWRHHDHKLVQCLSLRRFEESFRRVQAAMDAHTSRLSALTDLGDSPERAHDLLMELGEFEAETRDDVSGAESLHAEGERFISEDHYAVDCIRPKCLELQRICEQYKELLRRRQELLAKSKDLQDRIQRASQWCTKGVDLLSCVTCDQNSPLEGVHAALRDVEAYIDSERDLGLADPQQVKVMFDDIITPEMKVALEQVLQRLVDVRTMAGQKRVALRKLVDRPPRPVQTVLPEARGPPPVPRGVPPRRGQSEDCTDLARDTRQRRSGRMDRSKTEVSVIHPEWSLPHMPRALDSDSDADADHNDDPEVKMNTLLAKQKRKRKMTRHVMRELIETEKLYVSELRTIVEGYIEQFEDPEMAELLPQELKDNKEVVFGNLQEICTFHETIFLKELEACRDTPSLVGKCFVARKEEFQMYSEYCQNKVSSDAVRQQAGEENSFFKACQLKLGHKLPLGAYLLKPVQRVTKYQLLLKEMLKFKQTDTGTPELEEALETMLSVLKYVNDIMHQVSIVAYQGNLSLAGRLLMQGSFSVWRENKKVAMIRDLLFKPMQRHIFLYEKMVMFCKKKDDTDRADRASYIYKHSLQMAQVGLTETVRGDKKKFEIWLHGRSEVYTIQAPSLAVKQTWVSEIKRVLLSQFDQIKETAQKLKTISIGSASDGLVEPLQQPTSAPKQSTLPPASTADFSPRGIRKSYSIDSYSAPAPGLHKSHSTDSHGMTSDLTSELTPDPREDGWSSDEGSGDSGGTHTGREDTGGLPEYQEFGYSQRYVALAPYSASEPSETSLTEGDMVEVLQIGNKGWWYVRNLATLTEGWTPASFLDCAKRCSAVSTQSTLSSGSTGKTLEEEEDETTA